MYRLYLINKYATTTFNVYYVKLTTFFLPFNFKFKLKVTAHYIVNVTLHHAQFNKFLTPLKLLDR